MTHDYEYQPSADCVFLQASYIMTHEKFANKAYMKEMKLHVSYSKFFARFYLSLSRCVEPYRHALTL